MRTRVSGVVAILVATALWLTTGGALLAAAQGSSPAASASGPTPTISCQVVSGTCTYMIAGQIYDDLNGNGMNDAGEPGVPGVNFVLYSGNFAVGTPVGYATMYNSYVFDGLAPGTYTVVVDQSTLPAGFIPVGGGGGGWGTMTITIGQSGEIFNDFAVMSSTVTADSLPFTGGSQGTLAIVGITLMAIGTGAFVVRRRIEPIA